MASRPCIGQDAGQRTKNRNSPDFIRTSGHPSQGRLLHAGMTIQIYESISFQHGYSITPLNQGSQNDSQALHTPAPIQQLDQMENYEKKYLTNCGVLLFLKGSLIRFLYSTWASGVELKSRLQFQVTGTVDTIRRYWPPGAILEGSLVTTLDNTLNSDALARCKCFNTVPIYSIPEAGPD
ncbi:hypothetical protein UY3_11894 [Chelonia mydas]|uniref:Uncharacterized protein n=1 Tax=Chelonia mydas TaxID=8469 RepID=M7AZK5_CHEMY|nr:hypothetical protein UY3_11894 [Chelonia mydas]